MPSNNCTHAVLYYQPKAYLRRDAALALQSVQKELAARNMSLLVYDAYRPLSVTRKIWDAVHDTRYAARPGNASSHNRGLSVDVALYDVSSACPLDMGSGFDSFSDSSAISFTGISKTALANRKLLRAVMIKYGFKPLATEWWHFSFVSPYTCEVLDIPIGLLP